MVMGSTGEYSDHREWMVRAFTTESAAKDFVKRVTQRAQEVISRYEGGYMPDGVNELDPNMRVDYTGVNYSYEKCELVGKFSDKPEPVEEDNSSLRRIVL